STLLIDAEPFDADQWLADIAAQAAEMDTMEYKVARAMAAAERARQLEWEEEQRKEAAVQKELPGLGESIIPIWGSGKSSVIHFQHGNYGRGIFWGVMAISDVFLVKSLVVGGGKLVIGGIGRAVAHSAPEIAAHTAPEIAAHTAPEVAAHTAPEV